MRNIVVTDFDGTVTKKEFYQVVRERVMLPDAPDFWLEFERGAIPHYEAMARFCAAAGCDESTIQEVIVELEVESDLGKSIQRLKTVNWSVEIASSGCDWYIAQALAKAHITDVPIHSNRGYWEPGRGIVLKPPIESPFFDPVFGINKAAVVRAAKALARKVAFVGDGLLDVPAALLVSPDLRFAKKACAEELRKTGESYQHFERWADVAEQLMQIR